LCKTGGHKLPQPSVPEQSTEKMVLMKIQPRNVGTQGKKRPKPGGGAGAELKKEKKDHLKGEDK